MLTANRSLLHHSIAHDAQHFQDISKIESNLVTSLNIDKHHRTFKNIKTSITDVAIPVTQRDATLH